MVDSTIHPLARLSLATLELPGPIKKIYYTDNHSAKYDLSNSTNPYGGHYAEYPSLNPLSLKNIYLNTLQQVQATFFPQLPFPSINLDQLLFTVGSIEGIDLMLRAFCEPLKDSICTLEPTFPAYTHWAKIQGLTVKSLKMEGETFNIPPLQKIIDAHPKMIFICNPNNPTGTVIPNETILKICQAIPGLVIVDEAYIEFADQPSMLEHIASTENLVVLRTLSKAWGMAGLRCGMIFGSPKILNVLRYIQVPFGLSSPSQKIMAKILQSPQKMMTSWIRIKKERDLLFAHLTSMPSVKKIYKSSANFIYMQLNKADHFKMLMEKSDIFVADCSHVSPDFIKVSMSTPQAHKAFINILKS